MLVGGSMINQHWLLKHLLKYASLLQLTALPSITTRQLRLEECGFLSAVSLWQESLNVAKISLSSHA
jgi:hypothetical protein